MIPFSWETRASALSKLKETHFDIIVIGGGITGAGVLRDATLRGLKTLLVEKDDFASGTSSKSSKLVHGGLRYLKQYDFALTRESCQERNLLTRQNPHLIRPIPFVFPIYKGDSEGPWMVRAGMWLYEFLSGFQNYRRHRMLSRNETLDQVPDLDPEGLRGAAYYYDAAVDDVRLTLETIKSGVRHGGLALNHAPVTGLLHSGSSVVGVTIKDGIEGGEYEARASAVVNATGVWVDSIRAMDGTHEDNIRPSKGVHIVISRDRIRQKATIAFSARRDGRMLYAIPWGDVTLIGTTDTSYDGDPDRIPTESPDVAYLLEATNRTFPGAKLDRECLVSAFAGIRPLIAPEERTGSTADISREHQIFEDNSGLLSIAGGKLTTYRKMAKDLVDLALKRLPPERRSAAGPSRTEEPLAGSTINVGKEIARLEATGQSTKVAEHLIRTYGPDIDQVLESCAQKEEWKAPILQGGEYLRGEIAYAINFESALHLADLLARRLRFAIWVPGQGLEVAEDVSQIMASLLGWSEEQRKEEISLYSKEISSFYRPIAKTM